MENPGFVYIRTPSDCAPVEIDGLKDRDTIIGLKGNQSGLWAWLNEQVGSSDDMPSRDEIRSVEVEMWDDAKDALAGGNETVEVWAVHT